MRQAKSWPSRSLILNVEINNKNTNQVTICFQSVVSTMKEITEGNEPENWEKRVLDAAVFLKSRHLRADLKEEETPIVGEVPERDSMSTARVLTG